MSRYARQEILPQIGSAGQAAIRAARVLVVGAGGLGAPVLQYLAGAGVGTITLVDGDVVSLSNLHRQTLFREDQVGLPKADCAAQTLSALNADCKVNAICAPLTPANVAGFLDAQVVLDCADSFAVSYILSDACKAAGVPLVSASALGMTGYAGGFCGSAPSLRAVFPDLPAQAGSCATAGVLGPVVGAVGAMQAQMALALIAGLQPSPMGQLVTYDAASFRTGGFRFHGAPEPQAGLGFMDAGAILPDDFVVDLRGPSEAPVPAAPHAKRHDVAEFAALKPAPGAGQRAVLACRSGLRAWHAARALQGYWDGEILLIAMGDAPASERQNT